MTVDKQKLIDELTSFVMNSSDSDNLIISIFIAGMQAKGNPLIDISSKGFGRQRRS